jgi:hypothetical protein
MIRSLSLLLALAFACTSCSFTKAGRQKRAYEKYVRKSSFTREKQRSHFLSKKPQMPTSPMPTEPLRNSETSPQSVPPEDSQ